MDKPKEGVLPAKVCISKFRRNKKIYMNQYEITVLYHPDLEIDLDKATNKVEKSIKDNGGKIINVDNWGKRKLAYTIKTQEYAVYVCYTVDMPGENVKKTGSLLLGHGKSLFKEVVDLQTTPCLRTKPWQIFAGNWRSWG